MISDMTLPKDQAKAQLLEIRKKHSMAHTADGFTDAEYKDLRQLIDNIYQSFDSIDLMRRGIGVNTQEPLIEEKSKALIYAETQSFSHDISHCNPSQVHLVCSECKRYAAHLQLKTNEDEFIDGLYSYISEPRATCVDQNFKLFLKLN